jgi:phenylacetate-CoA oxygenase PaaI subunit
MPPKSASASRDALFHLVARLADNKNFLGRNYAEWSSGAPTLESAVAAAAMAQDELGHARALYPLLKTLAPNAGPEVEPDTRVHFLRLSLLDQPFPDWLSFVVANALTDNALTTIFAAAQESSYEPLAGRARKVLQEEGVHATHGFAWARRLAGQPGPIRDAFAAALRREWAETLCWFGPSGALDPLSADGVLDADPDTLRARFLAAVVPQLTSAGLDLPARAEGDGYELTESLPWERWDAETYRLKATSRQKSKAASR